MSDVKGFYYESEKDDPRFEMTEHIHTSNTDVIASLEKQLAAKDAEISDLEAKLNLFRLSDERQQKEVKDKDAEIERLRKQLDESEKRWKELYEHAPTGVDFL